MCVERAHVFFFFKQKTAYEMRISDWSSDVCSSDLVSGGPPRIKSERRDDRIAERGQPERERQIAAGRVGERTGRRSEEHTSELQSLMRISYAVFCLTKKNLTQQCRSAYNNELPHTPNIHTTLQTTTETRTRRST